MGYQSIWNDVVIFWSMTRLTLRILGSQGQCLGPLGSLISRRKQHYIHPVKAQPSLLSLPSILSSSPATLYLPYSTRSRSSRQYPVHTTTRCPSRPPPTLQQQAQIANHSDSTPPLRQKPAREATTSRPPDRLSHLVLRALRLQHGPNKALWEGYQGSDTQRSGPSRVQREEVSAVVCCHLTSSCLSCVPKLTLFSTPSTTTIAILRLPHLSLWPCALPTCADRSAL